MPLPHPQFMSVPWLFACISGAPLRAGSRSAPEAFVAHVLDAQPPLQASLFGRAPNNPVAALSPTVLITVPGGVEISGDSSLHLLAALQLVLHLSSLCPASAQHGIAALFVSACEWAPRHVLGSKRDLAKNRERKVRTKTWINKTRA